MRRFETCVLFHTLTTKQDKLYTAHTQYIQQQRSMHIDTQYYRTAPIYVG